MVKRRMDWWVGCLHCCVPVLIPRLQMPEYGIKMNRRFTQRALCGKWYEMVAAWLGEYHQVMAGCMDYWQV